MTDPAPPPAGPLLPPLPPLPSSRSSPLSQAQRASALPRLADALAWPLLLLDAEGVLLHANLAARQCLADHQPLRLLAHQRLMPAAAPLQQAFVAALQAAAAGRPQGLAWPTPAGTVQGRLHRLPQEAGTETLLMLALAVDGQPGPDLPGYASASHLMTVGRLPPALHVALSLPLSLPLSLSLTLSQRRSKTSRRQVAATVTS